MSEILYNFEKILYLPSGGLLYPPFAYLLPVTQELSFLETDPFAKSSTFEYYLTIIKKHIKLNIDILNLNLQDFYYILIYILTVDILQSTEYRTGDICIYCQKMNKIFFDFSKLNYIVYNKYDSLVTKDIVIKKDDVEITFERRKVAHNIEYGNLILQLENYDVYLYIIHYFLTQIKELKFNNEIINQNDYFIFFKNNRLSFISYIFNTLIEKEQDFGMENKVVYNCLHCKQENKTIIFNNFYLSMMSADTGKNILFKQEEMLKYALNLSALPMMEFDKTFLMPLRFSKAFSNVMQNMKVTPTSGAVVVGF